MFKLLLIAAVCLVAFAEAKPPMSVPIPSPDEMMPSLHRVARNSPMEIPAHLAMTGVDTAKGMGVEFANGVERGIGLFTGGGGLPPMPGTGRRR